uniref:Uncharacterized protein n=1 Tax=Avena sativa TaxID=4498 RepID=A0ACD5TS17_AVESA
MAPPTPTAQEMQEPWEYILRKYILMLATLVATVAYAVGLHPPGGVWQDTNDASGQLAGEPIARTTNRLRYLVFFYCNATAFVSSILVIVLFLLLSIQIVEKKHVWIRLKPLRVLMVLDLLSFMAAFAAGTCRDVLTTVYTSVLMAAAVLTYLTVQMALAWRQLQSPPPAVDLELEGRLRKVFMLLSTFAASIMYVAGLNTPGGFWDNTEGSHRAGDPILNAGHHKARLVIFFVCDTAAFVASLLTIMLLLGRKLHERTVRSREMYGCILVTLVGLVGAFSTGSCGEGRPIPRTYLLVGMSASLVYILGAAYCSARAILDIIRSRRRSAEIVFSSAATEASNMGAAQSYQSRSLLLLLATFATAIAYQAGLAPPGGVWQDNNGDWHIAGDPILLTMDATRYKTFLYCNSFAFVASLVTIFLVMMQLLTEHHMAESVMILELFGLIGAYAAGACREVTQSIYVMALAGAILFYVVIHVIFFSLEQVGNDFYFEELKEVEKKRKLLYLLATLSTAMSYQAGLTPPGGFWLRDDEESRHYAGNSILLYHHPRRYNTFFYCNSVSFMLSVIIMILLVSPVLYGPAIRS